MYPETLDLDALHGAARSGYYLYIDSVVLDPDGSLASKQGKHIFSSVGSQLGYSRGKDVPGLLQAMRG